MLDNTYERDIPIALEINPNVYDNLMKLETLEEEEMELNSIKAYRSNIPDDGEWNDYEDDDMEDRGD